jgi:predicted RNA polymerase sigma factor
VGNAPGSRRVPETSLFPTRPSGTPGLGSRAPRVTAQAGDRDADEGETDLSTYHLFHAIRADLLRRLGRGAEAATAYERAIELTENAAEREFLRRRRQSMDR